jgi:cobalt-zinc-cadmium efflux system protein
MQSPNHPHHHHRKTDHHPEHKHHDHSGHHHHGPANYNRAFAIGMTLNLGFVIVEVVYGIMAHSVALLADGGHNLSDVLGLALAWGASVLTRRQPTPRRTYGLRRTSILTALFNAMFLLMVTGGIAWEAIQRLFHPDTTVQAETLIWVAMIGIAINTGTALMFLAGRKNDINIRAAFMHMAADAMVSAGVVVAGIAILFTQWFWLDPAFSLAISALIVINTWDLLQESFHLAIDGVPKGIDERAVRQYLTEQSGVTEVHDLHIWGMSTTESALTVHLLMPSGHPGDAFLVKLCQDLHHLFGIDHPTIQVELGDGAEDCLFSPDHRV